MSNFIGTVLTNEGKKLLGKVLAGEKLTFTKVCVGDGDVAEADIKDLTDLASYKLTLPITTIQDQGDGTVKIRSTITNRGLTTGFFIRELGLFAQGEDGIEILYAYTKSIDADFFPAETAQYLLEEIFEIITIIDQGEININIDGTVVFATIKDVEDRIAECKAECCSKKSGGLELIFEADNLEPVQMTGQQEFILDLNVVIPEQFHWISIETDENTSYCIVPRALLVSSIASNYPVVLTDGRLDMNGDGVPYARIDLNSNKLTLRRGWISEYKNIRVMGLK